MSIKETIRTEIERLKSLHSPIPFGDNYEVGYSDGYQDCCDSILAILDTIPEQPAEGLEEELKRYLNSDEYINTPENGTLLIARHFAEWGAEHLKR